MAVELRLIKIFVEGDGDKVFLRDILKLWYNIELKEEQLKELIVICKGYNQIQKRVDEFKQVEKDGKRDGGHNIVIFDSDYSGVEDDHGFLNKRNYLDQQKVNLGISFDLFLFPNHQDDGTLESMIETCINKKHIDILDCWKNFEQCVSSKNAVYTIPADKSKIYVYLECLFGKTNKEKEKIKDPNRDFTISENWTIDFNTNQNLAKLKKLLDTYFA